MCTVSCGWKIPKRRTWSKKRSSNNSPSSAKKQLRPTFKWVEKCWLYWHTDMIVRIFQEYGDLEIGKLKVAEFQGYTNTTGTNGKKVAHISPLLDAVPSGDVPLEILRQQLKWSSSHEAADIQRKIRHTEKVKWSLPISPFHCVTIQRSISIHRRSGNSWKTRYAKSCRRLPMVTKPKLSRSWLSGWNWPISSVMRNSCEHFLLAASTCPR